MQLPAIMKSAKPTAIRPHHVPHLPEWFPLPHNDGTAELTPAERGQARHARRVSEATSGPIDGQRFMVAIVAGQPPERFVPSSTPGTWYELDRTESTRTALVYRYDMDCPDHQQYMRAVEDAFRETGQDYSLDAREDTTDDRTAPAEAFAAPPIRLGYPGV